MHVNSATKIRVGHMKGPTVGTTISDGILKKRVQARFKASGTRIKLKLQPQEMTINFLITDLPRAK